MKVAKPICVICGKYTSKQYCTKHKEYKFPYNSCEDHYLRIDYETEIPIEQMLKSLKRAYNHYGPFCELEDVSIIESIKEAIEAAEGLK